MKFEKLTNTKIRIVFTSEDMIINNLSSNNFFDDVNISQTLLQSLLFKAEKEIGFKTDDSKLLVEALSSDGGFVFIITKLSSCDDLCLENKSIQIFKFQSFDSFLDLCTYIKNMNFEYLNNSSLILYNNSFYLYVLNCNPLFSNILLEFADFVPYSLKIDGHFNEYGKIIFNKNAINKGINIINKKTQ